MNQKFLTGIETSGNLTVDSQSAVNETVFDVQGTQGQLFSVTNGLSGDLFSVSDISGIPILNINSSGAVDIDGNINIDGTLTINNNVTLQDGDYLRLGTAQDLQIYHNGSHSFIDEVGTGSLYIRTNGSAIYLQDTSNNPMAQFTDGGGSFLMYNGNLKLSTTNTGIDITGEVKGDSLDIDGNADISGNLTGLDNVTSTNFIIGGHTINDVDQAGQFVDADDHLMSSAAIQDKILGYGYSTTTGTVTGTGAANRIAYWASSSQIQSNSGFTFDGTDFTAPGAITGASLDINGNADISGNLTGVDSITASATVQAEHLYSTDDLVVDDDATISGDLTVSGVTYGAYHSVVDDQYCFDDYNGSRNLALFYKNNVNLFSNLYFLDNLLLRHMHR